MKFQSDIYDLTENKLIILFVLQNINIPLTNSQITELVMKDSYINYFMLQQYISELINTKLISSYNEENVVLYKITKKGIETLKFFIGRIKKSKREMLLNIINDKKPQIKKAMEIISDYTPVNKNSFMVECKIIENNFPLIELKIAVGSKADAKKMCESWKNDPQKIYMDIISSFDMSRIENEKQSANTQPKPHSS